MSGIDNFLNAVNEGNPDLLNQEEQIQEQQQEETQLEENQEEKNPLIEATDNQEQEQQPAPEEWFKTNFDGYESPEQLKERLAKIEELENSVKEFDTFKTSKQELEEKYNSLKESTFGDDKLFKLSKIADDGVRTVTGKILYGNPTPEELLKLSFIKENPSYKDRDEEVERLVMSEYKYDKLPEIDEDGDPLEGNIQINKERLQIVNDKMTLAAETAKGKLLSDYNSIEMPKDLSPEEAEKAKAEQIEKQKEEDGKYIETWRKPFESLKESTSKMSFKFSDDKGENSLDIEIPLSDDDQKGIQEEVAKLITENRLEPNQETVDYLKQVAENTYFLQNKDKIVMQVAAKARLMNDQEWTQKVHNPAPDVNDDKPATSGNAKQQAFKDLLDLH